MSYDYELVQQINTLANTARNLQNAGQHSYEIVRAIDRLAAKVGKDPVAGEDAKDPVPF